MLLSEVLAGADAVRRLGKDVPVTGVEYDSRRVVPGSVFVAMHGGTTDGNLYIEQASAMGATAIVTDSAVAYDCAAAGPFAVALAEVPHGRRALATLSANFFGHPERRLVVTGITGTNGKTTTAFLLEGILRQVRRSTVLVGTIEYHVGDLIRPAPHTTPESRDLLALFAEGVALGATEAVMEVSSHGLEQGRVWGVPFDTAVFTNLTRDHLDFHGDMEAYFRAKQRLFDESSGDGSAGVKPPRFAVINTDDKAGQRLAEIAAGVGSQVLRYGIHSGNFRATEIAMGHESMRFRLTVPEGTADIKSRLTGRVNVYNLLAASAAAIARGLSLAEVAEVVPKLRPVPGRFEAVSLGTDAGQDFAVIVDYAHTDDALRNVIALARELVHGQGKQNHGARVITVFGCGGDRDRTKRPLMGRAAGEGSDLVIATSDNPRSEDPQRILEDIVPGLRATASRWTLEVNRVHAIRIAIAEARAGDFVLIAGKGHEKTQTIGGRVLPFDDVAEARRALEERFGAGAEDSGVTG